MKSLLLIGILIGVVAAQDECAWGPSYWCSSIEVAKKCGAFRHCMTTVWPNQQLEQDDTDICTYCETVVQDAKNYIGNKQTQAQIKQFLDSACAIIPVKEMAQQCQTTVDQYLPEVLDLLTAELDPQMVCSLLGLCNGVVDQVKHHQVLHRVPLIKFEVPKEQAPAICADCKKFMTDLKDMMTSAESEKEVEELLEQNLCAAMGTFVEECKGLVEAYVPEIMQMVADEFDPNVICEAMGFCNQTSPGNRLILLKLKLQKSPLYKMAAQVAGAEECDVCKAIVSEIQNLDKDKTTQEEIENLIKTEICNRLGSMKQECDETVDTYGPILFQLLAEELDPDNVCTTLGLCSAKLVSNTINTINLKASAPKPKVKSSAQCVVCEFVMKELDSLIGNNATQEEIIAALDKVCSIMPSTVEQECTDFINTYAEAIMNLLSQELDPQMVCTTLGLCSSGIKGPQTSPVRDPELCGVCKIMVQYISSLLSENATIEEIEKTLDKVCNFLPDAMKQECDDLVKEYGPLLVKELAQFTDPTKVCTDIGLCGSSEVPLEMIVPAKAILVGTNECTYGPSFWCASRENAEKCKAVEHCKKHAWNV